MAVEWVKIRRQRTYTDEGQKKKAQMVYLVKCDDADDGADVALAECPAWGDSIDALPGLTCLSAVGDESSEIPENGALYEVTCDFASVDPAQLIPNPLDRPPVVRLSHDSFEETAYQADAPPEAVDVDDVAVPGFSSTGDSPTWKWGKSICNSASKPFDPSIAECYRNPVVAVTVNLPELPWDFHVDYMDSLNKDNFTITYRGRSYNVTKHQAWLADIQTEPMYENGVEYEQCTFVFKLRKTGWLRRIRDEGFEELFNGDFPPRKIKDDKGDPITQPAHLNGKGARLPNATDKPVFLKFRLKKERNFGTIPFL